MNKPIPLGPFELRHVIGRGGMGEVWSGLHIAEGMPVAIKVVTAEGARKDSYLDSFRNEVRAVAALHHPGIVAPLEYGAIDLEAEEASGGKLVAGSPYIAMELALRGSLRKYQAVLGWDEIRISLLTVLEALAHAHAEGIIHRDLKPANVLVGCGTQAPGIKLTDFGLARLAESFERAGSVEQGWGTPHYMAPEQFRGTWRDYGPWTDLYALGCMAFELVDGEPPFVEASSSAFARAHALDAPRPIKPRIPVPEEFEPWVMRLLQKSPEDRFQLAADAAHMLRLMEAPPASRKRKTVTLLPVKGPTTAPTEDPEEEWSWDELDRTIMDRPQTTQVLQDNKIRETTALAAHLNEALTDLDARGIRRLLPPMPTKWQSSHAQYSLPQLYGVGLGLFGIRALPMVGRETKRNQLWAALRRARETRTPQTVILRGGPGAGKSRLATWLAKRAQELGAANFMVATHGTSAGEMDGLRRMFSSHMRCVGLFENELCERVNEVLLREAGTSELRDSKFAEIVLMGQAEDVSSERMTRSDQRYALMLRYLEAMADRRPLVVVLDDVQWGADALGFLNWILDRPRELPVLFVLTLRQDLIDQEPVEASLIDEIKRRPTTLDLEVPPLDELEIDNLVREMLGLDGALADEVEERSGGNPLFAVQLVTELVQSAKLQLGKSGFVLKHGEKLELPNNIFELWASRLKRALAGHTSASRIALEIAAALGREVSNREWQKACELAQLDVEPHLLDTLVAHDLIQLGDDGWSFVHGLLRESVELWSKQNGRWEAVNAACSEMLLNLYTRHEFPFSERMANFLAEADEGEASLGYRLEAADIRVEMCDFARAEEHIRKTYQTAHQIGLDRESLIFGRAQVIAARANLYRAHYDEASRLAQMASIEARKHNWPKILRDALEIEAQGKLARGSYKDALRLFERSLEAFTTANDVDGVGRAILGIGRTYEAMGDLKKAETFFEESRMTFAAKGNLNGVARALNALGDAARGQGYLHTARNFANQAMQHYQELGNRAGQADCLNDMAELARHEQDYDQALTYCMQSIELFESIGSDESMVSRLTLGLILRDYARFSEALRIFDQCYTYFKSSRQLGHLATAIVHMLACLAAEEKWATFEEKVLELEPLRSSVESTDPDLSASLKLAREFAHGAHRETLAIRVTDLFTHETV